MPMEWVLGKKAKSSVIIELAEGKSLFLVFQWCGAVLSGIGWQQQ